MMIYMILSNHLILRRGVYEVCGYRVCVSGRDGGDVGVPAKESSVFGSRWDKESRV